MKPKARPGTIEEAIAHGRSLVDAHPEVAFKQAEILLRSGDDPRAHRLAAAALRRLGQMGEAEAAELAAIAAGFKDPQLEEAALAQADGRSGDAWAIARAALASDPDDLLALTLAAEAAIGLRDYKAADQDLGKVLERAPSFLRAAMLRAKSLMGQSRMSEAIAVAEEVLGRKPDNVPALRFLAQATTEVGDHERALAAYERLLATGQSEPENWIMYAQTLRILGRSDESKAAFRKALSLDPAHGAAWWGLAYFFPTEITAADEEAIRHVLTDREGTSAHAAPAHIALSILAERRDDYSEAFHHVSEGKRLRNESLPYNPDFVTADVDQVLEDFTSALYSERSACGSKDESPIFVVGIPRSGSTLVERILGRHPKIEAAGELQIMPRLVERLRYRAGQGQSYSRLAASLSCRDLSRLGDSYAERSLDYRHTGKPMFVDKLNLNWLHAGLIRLILPNARIIDARRDALDCCWSNFKMLFAAGHANDLRGIGRFYRDYVRFMAGIDEAAPGAILQVRYEDVVANVETETRRMLAFLGLDYDPDCIDFHLSDAPVATPSSEQVRKPINRASVGSSDPYRQWLGPLIEELGPLAREEKQDA